MSEEERLKIELEASNITICLQVEAYKKLQQENKQLKLDYELYKDNHIYKNYEVETKDNIIKQLKEVIKEVREYINKNTELEHDGDDYGYTEWVNIKPQNIVFINDLLQILDKAKNK